MKTLLAILGGFVLTLTVLGAAGVGHFRLYYGPDNFVCTKEQPE